MCLTIKQKKLKNIEKGHTDHTQIVNWQKLCTSHNNRSTAQLDSPKSYPA